jgi:hypothetical protein
VRDRWEQLRAWGNYDPAPDLRRCGVSMTAFFGANDPLVPIEASIEALYSTAAVANRMQTHHVFVIPHSFEQIPGVVLTGEIHSTPTGKPDSLIQISQRRTLPSGGPPRTTRKHPLRHRNHRDRIRRSALIGQPRP